MEIQASTRIRYGAILVRNGIPRGAGRETTSAADCNAGNGHFWRTSRRLRPAAAAID